MKVLFLTNIPSPYRVDFFNELGKYCDLTVLFEKGFSNERDDSWKNYSFDNFNGVFLKGNSVKTDSAISFEVINHLKNNKYDKIICTNFSTITGMLAICYMRIKKIPYYLESDGGFKGSGKGVKEFIKKYFIKGARGYFSTAKAHDEYYLTYGATKDKLIRYPFTALKQEDILKEAPTAKEKASLRRELGIAEEKVVLSVGQFIHRKGFDLLINAAKDIPNNCGIYIVGGEPTEEYIKQKEELGLSNVHFVGFKLKEELKKYYRASDLFVLPTRMDIWGLVVNEAMAAGLPIVTTNKCIAGLKLVENDVNGYIVPINDADALAKSINNALIIPEMGQISLEKIRNYTIEEMAKRHIEIFEGEN